MLLHVLSIPPPFDHKLVMLLRNVLIITNTQFQNKISFKYADRYSPNR